MAPPKNGAGEDGSELALRGVGGLSALLDIDNLGVHIALNVLRATLAAIASHAVAVEADTGVERTVAIDPHRQRECLGSF